MSFGGLCRSRKRVVAAGRDPEPRSQNLSAIRELFFELIERTPEDLTNSIQQRNGR
jgi:hypothetical protein